MRIVAGSLPVSDDVAQCIDDRHTPGPECGNKAGDDCGEQPDRPCLDDDRRYELDAGDSIKIHRELPHRFVNQSSAEAELIIIISPPTF